MTLPRESILPPVSAATTVLVVTGSGISAASGIPTFRGQDGYWKNHNYQELATRTGFEKNPQLVWEWYLHRRQVIRQAQPNAAHHALAKLAAKIPNFLLITQNVDDLDARAGMPREKVVQIHGDIFVNQCFRCDYSDRTEISAPLPVPQCPKCQGFLRPGVIWFDEELPTAGEATIKAFLQRGESDFAFCIGTTASFSYIVDWLRASRGANGRIVEINLEASGISPHADHIIREPAHLALPKLVNLP
jgi:NAD-dependent deacetylase